MQEETLKKSEVSDEIILLSPTGTGKTLAFLLPLLKNLHPDKEGVQALILVPSRELAIQVEQVLRQMGTGFKTNAVYGGRAMSQDKLDLKHSPAILIGTPGRIADHLRKGNVSPKGIEQLVLDEFDKSLEVGFETEMMEIIGSLKPVQKTILTSATQKLEIPEFVGLKNPHSINYLDQEVTKLKLRIITSPEKDKLPALEQLLRHLGRQPGIVFCNFRESIDRVSEYLSEAGIKHGCFYGGMEQKDRERSLIKFRNGTHQLLLATDLAARGIDVPEIRFIIHFHLPVKEDEFTHRNGRTARMHNEGTAYILKWENEELPDFIEKLNLQTTPVEDLPKAGYKHSEAWKTLFISGGRRDKISKGDIAGLFIKQGKLKPEELGLIEVKQDCAFAAVPAANVKALLPLVNNTRLKKKKVRVTVMN